MLVGKREKDELARGVLENHHIFCKEILKKKEEVKCLLQYARTQKCSTSTSNATNTRGLTQQVRVDQL